MAQSVTAVIAGTRIGHVHLKVADLDRALGFYCGVLGFEVMQRLDTGAAILKGGDTGPAVVPGKPSESLLIKAVRYSDELLRMPPKGKLPAAVVADLEHWVAVGAPDPRATHHHPRR